MKQLFCLYLSLILTTSILKVQAPAELAEYFTKIYPRGQIPYSIANYGNVPYGKTISGQVGMPSVLQDCVFQELPFEQQNKKILLVERNDCTFTQKSINVQKEGGKLAIIMDNQSQDPQKIVMIDDGRGAHVTIPTILISMNDGAAMLDAMRLESVIVSVSFQVVVKKQASLQIWIDIAQHQNFVFLRTLRPFFDKIKSHVDFSVAYPTKNCIGLGCLQTDCFYNLSYCRTDFKYYSIQKKGQLLIQQQLRQFYIHRNNPDKWWDYVLLFDQTCDDLAIVQQCSTNVMKKVGVNAGVINKQVQSSFGEEDNMVLRTLSQMKYNNSIVYYPSVVVNNMIYRGNLQPFEIYELICQSLQDQPQGCSGYIAPQNNSLSTWIIFIIVLVVFFGIFLIFCFRRIARRQISENINNQVNQLVNQYITMYENDKFSQGGKGDMELATRQTKTAQ